MDIKEKEKVKEYISLIQDKLEDSKLRDFQYFNDDDVSNISLFESSSLGNSHQKEPTLDKVYEEFIKKLTELKDFPQKEKSENLTAIENKIYEKHVEIGKRAEGILNCITKKNKFGLGARTKDRSTAGGIKRLIRLVDKDDGIFNGEQIIPKDWIKEMNNLSENRDSIDDKTDSECSSNSPRSSF